MAVRTEAVMVPVGAREEEGVPCLREAGVPAARVHADLNHIITAHLISAASGEGPSLAARPGAAVQEGA